MVKAMACPALACCIGKTQIQEHHIFKNKKLRNIITLYIYLYSRKFHVILLSETDINVTDDSCGQTEGLYGGDVYIVFNYWELISDNRACTISVSWF